ncbi:hypothetical protein ACLB2K_011372 [Fragaria x ananassa]
MNMKNTNVTNSDVGEEENVEVESRVSHTFLKTNYASSIGAKNLMALVSEDTTTARAFGAALLPRTPDKLVVPSYYHQKTKTREGERDLKRGEDVLSWCVQNEGRGHLFIHEETLESLECHEFIFMSYNPFTFGVVNIL